MTIKATHRGNCQVCGRQHHVMGRSVAKHGYTVTWGRFLRICRGSGKAPVQFERSLTDATIQELGGYAAECDDEVRRYKDGTLQPARIKTGEKLNRTTYKYEGVYIPFAEGALEQQQRAVEMAIAQSEGDARGARAHALDLKKMADELHGTALMAIVDLQPPPKAPKATVDVKAAKVYGTFGSKAARKAELDKLSRVYGKARNVIQGMTLAVPYDERTEAQNELYYGMPHDLHNWRAKYSAKALEVFPQAADIVATIEELVKARNAVKAAP